MTRSTNHREQFVREKYERQLGFFSEFGDLDQQRDELISRFESITEEVDGKLQRPKKYGRSLALLAKLYATVCLYENGFDNVISDTHLATLRNQLKEHLDQSHFYQIDILVDRAESISKRVRDTSPVEGQIEFE